MIRIKNLLNHCARLVTEVKGVLLLSVLFSLALLFFRVWYTGHLMFCFLAWNLFLAAIPYFITSAIRAKREWKGRSSFFFWLFAWVLVLPNSFYIVTDLFHLGLDLVMPLWFDLALLLSFAWNGLLFGMLSIRQAEKEIERVYGRSPGLFFLLPVMALNGLGVYIGRFLRYNSWDVLSDPGSLASEIGELFVHPLRFRVDWSMIVCYSLLLLLIYVSVKRIGRVL